MFAEWFHIDLFTGNQGAYPSQPLEAVSEGRSVGDYGIFVIIGTIYPSCQIRNVQTNMFLLETETAGLPYESLPSEPDSPGQSYRVRQRKRVHCTNRPSTSTSSNLMCFHSDLSEGRTSGSSGCSRERGDVCGWIWSVYCVSLHVSYGSIECR